MRKIESQISVALVCAILGFMITYQFKAFMKQDNNLNVTGRNNTDITVEIEQYKKQKSELEKKINELQVKIKEYEDSAAGKSEANKSLLKELEITRLHMGAVDVQGSGVVIYITPNNQVFGTNFEGRITDKLLVNLVNELRFAGAEAISINDIRVVGTTGIRNAGNYIMINKDDKISPKERIVIKAIGDKKLLEASLSFAEVFTDFKGIADHKFEKEDNIIIKKYNKSYKIEYAKPIS